MASESDIAARGFIVERTETGWCPRIRCVRCGALIEDYGMAGVVTTAGLHAGASGQAIVLCKPNCLNAPEYAARGYTELGHWFIRALHNIGVRTGKDFAELKEAISDLDGLG